MVSSITIDPPGALTLASKTEKVTMAEMAAGNIKFSMPTQKGIVVTILVPTSSYTIGIKFRNDSAFTSLAIVPGTWYFPFQIVEILQDADISLLDASIHLIEVLGLLY